MRGCSGDVAEGMAPPPGFMHGPRKRLSRKGDKTGVKSGAFWLYRRKNLVGSSRFDVRKGVGHWRDLRKERREREILTMVSRKRGVPRKGKALLAREGAFNSQVGATLVGDANDTVNADWSVGSAQGRITGSRDMPARRLSCCRYRNRSRRFKKLQRSLSVLRKRRGDHRWMQAGASSAVNSSHAWSSNFPSSEHGTRKWLCEVNVGRTRSSQKRQTGRRWRLSQRTVPTVETGASS